jgi:aspartate/methionine/tyrosine aminotransferase
VKGLNEVEGFRCVAPKGTFYAFPDVSRLNVPSAEIANKLLEEAKVASIPGSAFGAAGEGYLRFSFATSQQNIEEGISRVKAWRSKCK